MADIGKSSILRRLAALLFAVIISLTVLSSLLYSYLAQPLFVQAKKNELLPQAYWIADQVGKGPYLSTGTRINDLIGVSYNFYGVLTFLVARDGIITNTKIPDDWSEDVHREIFAEVEELNQGLIEGTQQERYHVSKKTAVHGELLYVFVPIVEQGTGNYLGAVFLLQPLSELRASLNSLNAALLLATLIVALILIVPVLIAVRHLVRPIIRLRELAVEITSGNFQQRAQIEQDNEIGDLAQAMNAMSQTLQDSFNSLNQERKRLNAIIEGIQEGIIAVDVNLDVTKSNSVIWQLFQMNPHIIEPEDLLRRTGLNDAFRACLEEEREINSMIKQDHALIESVITPLLDSDGEIYGAVGLFHDVTETERLEQTRRDYVANISHELRSPITSMRALLEPLSDGMVKDPETVQRYYGILLNETLRLSRLINDMLELSRLQSSKESLSAGPVNLRPVLDDIALRFSLQAHEENRGFDTEFPDGAYPTVWGNKDRIEQILTIFFDNALKFTPEEGRITLRLRFEDSGVLVDLEDQGKGIAAEDLPYVFDRFFKADKAHNEVGTGLGLSIAQEIAEQMHFRLSVTSAPGEGSVFSLKMPYAQEVMRREPYLIDVFGVDLDSEDATEARAKQAEEAEVSDADDKDDDDRLGGFFFRRKKK